MARTFGSLLLAAGATQRTHLVSRLCHAVGPAGPARGPAPAVAAAAPQRRGAARADDGAGGKGVAAAAAAAVTTAAAVATNPRRRGVLQLAPVGLATAGSDLALPAWAEGQGRQIKAAWESTDGVDFLTSFSEKAYGSMRDDAKRTPNFIKAIQQRVAATPPDSLVVLDIGTGPFALFALVAARAGAKKVYAVEANPEAVRRARFAVQKAEDVPPGKVEVIEGFTTKINLPEKVDLVVAEICGAIASEESMIATIQDAQARHCKFPNNPSAFIPVSCKTFVAPVSYALHPALAPPRYERLKGVPLRINCRDNTVQMLSQPVVFEDIGFFDPNLPRPGIWRPPSTPLNFPITEERLEANAATYAKQILQEGGSKDEAKTISQQTARTFSGLCFWPQLVLDEAGELVVDSRGPEGVPQKSHWPSVLALMTPTPLPVAAGDSVKVDVSVELQRDIQTPSKFKLKGEIVAGSA